jgi:D-glycero-alpha-D-manno-heptose-7-phosphate kinase
MIITQTPLRISFAGGGTDLKEFYRFEDGKVISTAIDKYIFVIVNERFDNKIYINYTKKEIVDSVDEIKHELVREAMKMTGIKNGIEVTMLADIPSEGSGLGSSSSLTVGLLNAFYIFQGEQVPTERLADEACKIEIDICKKPIGKQDQYIAAYGGIREFTFKKDGTVDVTKISLDPKEFRKLGSDLLLFYTNKTRKSSEILTEQKKNTEDKLEYLRKLKLFVPQVKNAIKSKQYHIVGEILHESWKIKKNLAKKITNNDINTMYEMALSAGAIGGKVSGAGGGGFLLLYVPRHKQDAVRNALKDYRELPFHLEQDGSKVIFNLRRYPAK